MYRILIPTLLFICFWSCSGNMDQDYLKVNMNDTTLSDQLKKITLKIQEDPSNHEYFYLRSNEWIKENKLENAFKDISTALDLNPKNAVYHYKKAELIMANDSANALEAIALLKEATELESSFEDAHFLLGKLRLARQEYESSLESFDQLVEIDPNNARAYFWKGIAFKENKFMDKAEEMFFKTVQVDNTYYDAYMQLGELYTQKDQKVALQFYENAQRLKPNSDECLYAMGRIYQSQNQYATAYEHYNAAIKNNAGHKFASYASAYIDVMFENYDKALETLDLILKLAPNYSNAITLKGFIYEKIGDASNAKRFYSEALNLNPKDSIAQTGLQALSSK